MPDPFRPLEKEEKSFRALFFGATAGGILGAVRSPPTETGFLRLVRDAQAEEILASGWWRQIWSRGAEKLDPALIRIAQKSGRAAWRSIAARITEGRAVAAAVETARNRAAAVIQQMEIATGQSLRRTVADLSAARELTRLQLRQELAARLGPTLKQLSKIRAWEAARKAEGWSRSKILTGIRSRTRNAVRARADGLAADHFARQLNAARTGVFVEDGIRVYSANVGDDRVRDDHRRQTRITRADPVLAGSPWPAAAPFSEGPPYEPGCR